jgi:hypothetical protein
MIEVKKDQILAVKIAFDCFSKEEFTEKLEKELGINLT